MKVCEECGSTGEGGELEYADGSLEHWRDKAAWADGKIHPIMCSGKFVEEVRDGNIEE
jgi:hypothetical protein